MSAATASEPMTLCAACPVWAGTCPRCGTYWIRRPDGKAYGLRPLPNGLVDVASTEQVNEVLSALANTDPAWRLFWDAHKSLIDRTWESAHPDGWTRKRAAA